MKKVSKQEWVEALKSGQYKKGHSALYREEDQSFCCLGVLCKLAGYDLEDLEGYGTLPGSYIKSSFSFRRTEFYSDILNIDFSQHLGFLTRINDQNKDFNAVIKYIETSL